MLLSLLRPFHHHNWRQTIGFLIRHTEEGIKRFQVPIIIPSHQQRTHSMKQKFQRKSTLPDTNHTFHLLLRSHQLTIHQHTWKNTKLPTNTEECQKHAPRKIVKKCTNSKQNTGVDKGITNPLCSTPFTKAVGALPHRQHIGKLHPISSQLIETWNTAPKWKRQQMPLITSGDWVSYWINEF